MHIFFNKCILNKTNWHNHLTFTLSKKVYEGIKKLYVRFFVVMIIQLHFDMYITKLTDSLTFNIVLHDPKDSCVKMLLSFSLRKASRTFKNLKLTPEGETYFEPIR